MQAREIKFRAWDRKKKKVFPVHELEFHKISRDLTKCVGYDDWDKDGYTMHGGGIMKYANGERYILMQYTGLKDRNGNEIYEGDILHDLEYDSGIGEVYWHEEYGGWLIRFIGSCHEWLADYHEHGEVIGNIYEHPQLLEVLQ